MYMGNHLLDVTSVPNGSITPTTGIDGEVFFNTTSRELLIWNTNTWIAVKGTDAIPFGTSLPASSDIATLFFLTNDQKVYIWNGTMWRPIGGAAYGSTLPPTGQFGDMYYNTATGLLYIWNGTGWSTLGARGYTGSTGNRGFSGSVGGRGYAGSAGSYGYTPVNKAGDTMTGPLYLNGNPTNGVQAANKAYVDAQVAPKFNTPNGTTSQYVRGNGSLAILNADTIGLGSVNNTTDVGKPVSTAQQAALNNKFNISGGNINGSISLVTSGATMNWYGDGNQHIWSRNANGSERGVIWNDGNTNQWNLRVRSGPTWSFANNGDTYLPGILRTGGGSILFNDGNIYGSIWSQWGDWYAFQAINNRINARSAAVTQEWVSNRNSTDVGTYIIASANGSVPRNSNIAGTGLWFWQLDQDGGGRIGGNVGVGTWKNMGADVSHPSRHGTIYLRVW